MLLSKKVHSPFSPPPFRCPASSNQTTFSLSDLNSDLTLFLVSKTSDHKPEKTFYFWTVKQQNVLSLISHEIFAAMYNLSKRKTCEVQGKEELFSRQEEEVKPSSSLACIPFSAVL